MNEIIGISGLDFRYAGIEISKEYPNEVTPGEVYFVVNATGDNNLLIVKHEVVNMSGTDIYLDMASMNLRIRIGYNDERENITSSMYSMLLNDMNLFQDVIPAGETVLLIAMCEVPVNSTGEIYSLQFIVRNEVGEFVLQY
jgi:hypothetical protein